MIEELSPPAEVRTKHSSFAKDRFIFWPVAFFYIIVFGPLLAGEFWTQDDVTGLFIWVASFALALFWAVVHFVKWHWKKSLSVLAAPFIACAVLALQLYLGFDLQWTKFQIMRPLYLRSVNGLEHASFKWPEHGVFSWRRMEYHNNL